MAQKWTILAINPSLKEITMRSAAGKVLVVPMGTDPKNLTEQQQVVEAAQKQHAIEQKQLLIKKVVLGIVIVALIATAVLRGI